VVWVGSAAGDCRGGIAVTAGDCGAGVALRTTASPPRDLAAAKKSNPDSAGRLSACPDPCAAARAEAAARATGTSVRNTAVSAADASPAEPPEEAPAT
jgi:hypothetical protein